MNKQEALLCGLYVWTCILHNQGMSITRELVELRSGRRQTREFPNTWGPTWAVKIKLHKIKVWHCQTMGINQQEWNEQKHKRQCRTVSCSCLVLPLYRTRTVYNFYSDEIIQFTLIHIIIICLIFSQSLLANLHHENHERHFTYIDDILKAMFWDSHNSRFRQHYLNSLKQN